MPSKASPKLANHPARLAAMKAMEKRFKSDAPCKHGHLWRYTEGLSCAECVDVKRKGKSNGGVKPTVIDDADEYQMRMIKANTKFLKLLYVEKLQSIRSGAMSP
jgi:hypothetical protein